MKTINKLLFATMLICFCSCEDVLEEDISDETPIVVYPRNNMEIESNVVNFQWNEIDGADDYRLQVYSTNQNMVVDTLVSSHQFVLGLLPGSYQWRVRGENFAYETSYSFPESFTLIETDDLTNQQVQLGSPASGIYTKNQVLTFSWSSVSAAQYYDFQLVNITTGSTIIHQEPEIDETTYTLADGIINQDGQYQWKVKAVNPDNGTETVYASRVFYVDTTIPNQPQNATPADDDVLDVNQLVTFDWSIPNDTGIITSPINFTFELAEDGDFTDLVVTQNSTSSDLQYTVTTEGTYFWRVKAVDQAGNESNYSNVYQFDVE